MTRRRPLAGERGRDRLRADAAATADRSERPSRPRTDGAVHGRIAVLDRGRARLRASATADDSKPILAPEPSRTPGQARARQHPDLLLLGALVVVVALVLTATLLALRARGADRTETARTEAVAAAESAAGDVLSYDYRHLDRDFTRAHRQLTGGFADDYRRTTEKVVRPTAEQVHAVVKAEVVASSVVRAAQNRVVVLLFVNQTTTSNRLNAPKVDRNRVRMTMTRVDGNWLVSQVDAL
jgi:Mce-associated membrane protein